MSKKILIADDEPFIRTLIVQTLEDFEDRGVKLLIASDGADAWKLAQAEHPDLVVLDVMMPKMNGYQVCERIKSEPALADTYVILLTAKGQEIDRQKGEEVGANEYVTKPFDPDYLIERTETLLDINL